MLYATVCAPTRSTTSLHDQRQFISIDDAVYGLWFDERLPAEQSGAFALWALLASYATVLPFCTLFERRRCSCLPLSVYVHPCFYKFVA